MGQNSPYLINLEMLNYLSISYLARQFSFSVKERSLPQFVMCCAVISLIFYSLPNES